MEKYDYYRVVKEDLKSYIKECMEYDGTTREDFIDGTWEGLYDNYYDRAFMSDSVTGNASGSYTFNTWRAEENVCHNLDLAFEAYEEFGHDGIKAEYVEEIDVTIRCYVLGRVLPDAIEELVKEFKEGEG